MITKKDFSDAIDLQVYEVAQLDEETGDPYMVTKIDLPQAAADCFDLAKKMLAAAQATLPDDIYLKEDKGKEIEIAGVKYKYNMYAETKFRTRHYRYIKNQPIQ